jgi:MIP family channel proteins
MYTFTWNKYIAELIGTFALVLFGSMSVTLYGASLDFLSIAFAHGLTLLILVYSIGPISGCHINPAVTIGAWIGKKISSFDGVMYIIFQLLGSALAGVVHIAILPVTKLANFGIPTVAAGNEPTGLVIEAILTFFLVLTIFGTAMNPKSPPGVAGVAIGLALTLGLIIGGPITGGALNPARWFGPAVAANSLAQWWVYIFGPIIGGGLAAYLYSTFFMKTEKS